jgi:hypothetical protein
MEGSEIVKQDWTSLELVDILRHHVSTILYTTRSRSKACRLVCRAWCSAFPPHCVKATPAAIQKHPDELQVILVTTYSVYLPNACSSGVEWLAKALGPNRNLVALYLELPGLTEMDASAIATLISVKFARLQSFKLFTGDDPCKPVFRPVADALGDTPNNLRSLDLSNCHLQDFDSAALLVALRGNRTIRRLHLSGRSLSPAGQENLLEFIKENRIVTDLLCSGSQFHHVTDFDSRLRDVLAADTTLRLLDLKNYKSFAIIFDAFKHNHTLRSLNLLQSLFDAAALSNVFSALRHNQGLQSLSLTVFNPFSAAPTVLGDFFKSNATLKKLDINFGIDDADFEDREYRYLDFGPMVDGLAQNSTLSCLTLVEFPSVIASHLADLIEHRGGGRAFRKICIQDINSTEYAPRFVSALARLPRLESLNMTWEQPGPDSAEAFVALVERSTTLKKLLIHQCRLGDAGMIRLCAAAAKSPTLRHLSFGGQQFQESVYFAVCDLIAQTRSLQRLEFDESKIPIRYRPMFEEALQGSCISECFLTFENGSSTTNVVLSAPLQDRTSESLSPTKKWRV